MASSSKTLLLFDVNDNFKEIVYLHLKDLEFSILLTRKRDDVFKILSEKTIFALFFNTAAVSSDILAFIQKVKNVHPLLPVIALVKENAKEEEIQLYKKGVTACLESPIHKKELLFQLNKISAERSEIYDPTAIRFEERTVVIPNNFTLVPQVVKNLVYNSLSPEEKNKYQVVLGLTEMVNNAIEHGNLGISYEEKSRALADSTFYELASERAARHPYNTRFVTVKVKIFPSSGSVEYEVSDEGEGFDWKNLPDPLKKKNLLSTSGRGVTIARHIFDKVIFSETGSRVTLIYHIRNRNE